MKNTGRKSAYDTKIRPKFREISKWSREGISEKEIARKLGISYSTFNKYKSEKTEFSELIKKGREEPVRQLENAMYKKAIGYKYTEVKITEGPDGKKVETTKKYAPPDVTAAIYLLKHWGKDRGYTNDPASLEIKKKELELKEKALEDKNW